MKRLGVVITVAISSTSLIISSPIWSAASMKFNAIERLSGQTVKADRIANELSPILFRYLTG